MDEYSILRKKRKKNAFAATSLLISIALALLVLVGAVLILGKVDTKELAAVNDDSNLTLGSGSDVTCVTLTKEMVFNNNLRNIKEAAISYFTNERLPQTVGDTVKITLAEMLDEKLVLNVIDSTNKTCFGDKTYVEVTKEKNEYVMKIFLSCSDMEDYILVHLGCYDYCDSKVCEKDVKKEYEYEYKKTTSCVMSPWSDWGAWKTTREKVSNLKKEDTKVETKTKDLTDTKEATQNVSYNCDKYDGYTLVNDKCVKETSIKDTKDATKVVTYDCNKYDGYSLTKDNKCYKETTTKATKDATKVVTYDCNKYAGYSLTKDNKCVKETTSKDVKDATKVVTYDCKKYSGYTLTKDNKCVKETTTKDVKDATPVYATKKVKEKYTCYVNECTTKTVFTCPDGKGCGDYPQTSCEKVKKTCTKEKEEKYISGYTCEKYTGYTLTKDNKCVKETTSKDVKDATQNVSYNCNKYDGYTLTSDNKCVKDITNKDSKDATQNVSYNCNKYDGYSLTKDNKCYKETTMKDTKDANKNVSYNCKKYDGYTLSEDKCIKTSSNTDTLEATKKVTYTCPDGYSKTNNNTCTMKTTEVIKTTYYRYATRTCDGGSTSIKWSTSQNDSILKGEGYKLTGNKRELIIK